MITSLTGGGAEKLLTDLVPMVNNTENVNAEVLVLSDEDSVYKNKLIENNITIYFSGLKQNYNPLHILNIRNKIIKGNYDFIHVHLFPSIYWTSIANSMIRKSVRPKLIMTEHSTHNKRRNKKYFKVIEKLIYNKYDKIISISDKTQSNLIQWLNINNNRKFKIIQNGIELDKYQNAKPYSKRELNNKFNENTILLCMVGRFSEQKDQKTIIETLPQLNKDIQLLLIGEGKLKTDHILLAKELNVADRVHFLGFRRDIPRIYKTVDIIIMSSHWEGFGLAAVEGMAASKPVIASNVEGLREIVNNGGILFNQGNSEQLVKEINELNKNSDHYKHTIKNGIEISKHYSIYETVNSYLKIYQDMY